MKSLWDDAEAATFKGKLGPRVYTSRLLGRDASLVLHGGGNTSVKLDEKDVLGRDEKILWVKGSGWDLETIEEGGFAPVRLAHLVELAKLPKLSDPQMVNELRTHMTKASAPTPSVEAILHAILPFEYVDHTHADAVVTITNTDRGAERIREIYGEDVLVVPYVMPGFDLARACAAQWAKEATPRTIGMVLLSHGIFSMGKTARESYERMIDLVTRAEKMLSTKKVALAPPKFSRIDVADLRKQISDAAGRPMIVHTDDDPRACAFAREDAAARGPATPDHVIRTKRVPMLGRDLAKYVAEYRAYFERHAKGHTMLDPAPRVILDPEWGLLTAGASTKDAKIARDIYRHTIDVILAAEALGGWRPLGEKDLFDVEYWDLEQAKLKSGGKAPVFQGEVALVTGTASGIGRACVDALKARGAAVVGIDLRDPKGDVAIACDVTDRTAMHDALDQTVRAHGGLDMIVLNAGIFPSARRIADLADDEWDRILRVNLDANLALLRDAHPLLSRSPRGGRVVVIGSKNVPAPGPGAAAYSASKAALTQLARVAALEWGKDDIRVNVIHPNAVFDTALWTDDVLASRAKQYGMTIDEYKKNNVLRVEVKSRDVAELAAEMCGPLFSKTTGAQVPIDGGNERVI